jgi:putative CocE/NonD family hydrolase
MRTTDTTHAVDGVDLAIRIFRPEGRDLPVLLQRTPYGRPADPDGREIATRALDAGYAVAYEDTRGRGDSGGAFEPWVHEGRDGAATVEWLANRPWSSGRVGTFGGSSPGQVQLLAAAERPRGLAAIAPMFAPSDLHRADFFQDGAMSALALFTWAFGPLARSTVARLHREGRLDDDTAEAALAALDSALDRPAATLSTRPLADLPAAVLDGVDLPAGLAPADLVEPWATWTARPTYDDYWRSFDPEPDYGRMAVPGLHVTGWYELCQHGTLANYRGLRDRTPAPQHLVVGPWTHGNTDGAVGERDFGDCAALDAHGVWDRHVAFFDTYVRDDPTPPFDDGQVVETFRAELDDGGGGEWTDHADWPPADAASVRWYLTAGDDGGRLARRPPAPFESPDRFTHDPADPVPTRGGPLCCGDVDDGPRDRTAVDARDDVRTYDTPPLSEPLTLAGPVRAELVVAVDTPDADVVATLSHVTDGGVYPVCSGIRRLRYRHGRDRESPVDGPVRVPVDMWDAHHRIPASDRLRLSVAGSDFPRFDAHPGTADPWRAATGRPVEIRLFHERGRGSSLFTAVRGPPSRTPGRRS